MTMKMTPTHALITEPAPAGPPDVTDAGPHALQSTPHPVMLFPSPPFQPQSRSAYLALGAMCENYQLVRSLGPLKLNLELTSRCNWDCPECPQPKMRRKKEDMPLDMALALIDQFAAMGGYYLDLFHFGEPLLYPHLEKVIRYAATAKNRPRVIHLNTNGSLMNCDTAAMLVRSGLTGINISALPSAGATWSGAVVFLADAKKNARSSMPFIQVQATDRPDITEADACALGADGVIHRRQLGLGRSPNNDITTCFFPCEQFWKHLVVCADGRVTPCCGDTECNLYVGNVAAARLIEIWHGLAMTNLRAHEIAGNQAPMCARCGDRRSRVNI